MAGYRDPMTCRQDSDSGAVAAMCKIPLILGISQSFPGATLLFRRGTADHLLANLDEAVSVRSNKHQQ